jgi:hypothetical protein
MTRAIFCAALILTSQNGLANDFCLFLKTLSLRLKHIHATFHVVVPGVAPGLRYTIIARYYTFFYFFSLPHSFATRTQYAPLHLQIGTSHLHIED